METGLSIFNGQTDNEYFPGSHLTSWEKNDNYYYTATSLKGPWTVTGEHVPGQIKEKTFTAVQAILYPLIKLL